MTWMSLMGPRGNLQKELLHLVRCVLHREPFTMRSDYLKETAKTSITTYTAARRPSAPVSRPSKAQSVLSVLNNNPKDWIGGICFGPLARNVVFFAKAVINIHQESSEWIIAPLTTQNNRLWVNHSSLTDLKCIHISNFFFFIWWVAASWQHSLWPWSGTTFRNVVQTQRDGLRLASEQCGMSSPFSLLMFKVYTDMSRRLTGEEMKVSGGEALWQKYWLFGMKLVQHHDLIWTLLFDTSYLGRGRKHSDWCEWSGGRVTFFFLLYMKWWGYHEMFTLANALIFTYSQFNPVRRQYILCFTWSEWFLSHMLQTS